MNTHQHNHAAHAQQDTLNQEHGQSPAEPHDHSICPATEARETSPASNLRLAVTATLHCLLGCGLGEIAGFILGTALGLGMWESMALAMSMGFVFGFALGIIPLLRAGFGFSAAFRMILISEGLSIAVMESAEALVQVYTPGVMEAGLGDAIFWYGMGFALVAGFVAALPINWLLIRRGIRHQH